MKLESFNIYSDADIKTIYQQLVAAHKDATLADKLPANIYKFLIKDKELYTLMGQTLYNNRIYRLIRLIEKQASNRFLGLHKA